MSTEKHDYIERITGWVMDNGDPDLAAEARAGISLDGVYTGASRRIHRLVRLAYLRGVRRGASLAWQARQPVTLRVNADVPDVLRPLSPDELAALEPLDATEIDRALAVGHLERLRVEDRDPHRPAFEASPSTDYRCLDPGCFADGRADRVACEACGRQGCDACIPYDDELHMYKCDHCPDGGICDLRRCLGFDSKVSLWPANSGYRP